MPERGFDTCFWTDPFVKKLSPDGKLLFSYLWTNDHCNQAGAYEIDLETIAFETKLPEAELPELLYALQPKVKWFQELEIIWVKNFVARQAKSPKFLIAAAKCLKRLNNNGLAEEVVVYNRERHRVSIPYQYYNDSVSIPSLSASASSSSSKSDEGMGVGKGEGGGTDKLTPTSESEYGESLSPGDREVISVWRSVKGFDMSPSDASELVARLRTEFPEIDILDESKKWAARKLSEPLTRKSRPSAQVWNFMCKRREFDKEGGEGDAQQRKGVRSRPQQERRRSLTRIPGREESPG